MNPVDEAADREEESLAMECYTSRPKILLQFLVAMCFVIGGYVLTTQPGLLHRVIGWVTIVFFGACGAIFPILFLRTGPQVIINDAGIEDRRWKLGVIPWSDVRLLSVFSIQSSKFLGIELVDPDKYLSRLPSWQRRLAVANRLLGAPEFCISFSGLTPGLRKVVEHLRTQRGLHVREVS